MKIPCWLYFKFRSEVSWVAVSGSGWTKYCQLSQLAKRLPAAAFIPFFGWLGYPKPLRSHSLGDRATHNSDPIPWVTWLPTATLIPFLGWWLPTATLIPFLGWQGYPQPLWSHFLGDRATHSHSDPIPWVQGYPQRLIPFLGWHGYLQPLWSHSLGDRATYSHFDPIPWVTGLPTAAFIPLLGWQGYPWPLLSHSLGERATHGHFRPVSQVTWAHRALKLLMLYFDLFYLLNKHLETMWGLVPLKQLFTLNEFSGELHPRYKYIIVWG